ncbi:Panacea domain-containing protein [Sulfitobacter litoralis]|uniref:Panacea domain-containing protein n=1 Tax=Sulfitobacter litoralis TaxID=335975 RepID=UPI002B278260|nr:Panacea domain-containing protein [Sulfitobacter litoralis]
MANIADIAAYFCQNYPHKSELSKTRLTKLVYLADWKNARRFGKQLTPIKWYFHNFGPYVEDVIKAVENDDRFSIVATSNSYGDTKSLIEYSGSRRGIKGLTDQDISVLDAVIEKTSPMYWKAFIKHVYSTKPIRESDRYRFLDLAALAKD